MWESEAIMKEKKTVFLKLVWWLLAISLHNFLGKGHTGYHFPEAIRGRTTVSFTFSVTASMSQPLCQDKAMQCNILKEEKNKL